MLRPKRRKPFRKFLRLFAVVLLVAVVAGLAVLGWHEWRKPKPGTVLDEAKAVGRTPASLRGADEDYFHAMDYGITHDPEKVRAALDPWVPGISAQEAVRAVVRGRNTWIVWTGGTDRLWDVLSRDSFGNIDFLKVVSTHPRQGYEYEEDEDDYEDSSHRRYGRYDEREAPDAERQPEQHHQYTRANRWKYLGLVNEPCFRPARRPRRDRYGLWLDERVKGPGCPPDPFENEAKYPGVEYGARGKNIPAGSYYGYGSGVIGLRLLPNPDFDEKAEKAWDAEKYYTDPKYYNDKDLIKPYRVGMSCGFCHVGPNPSNPPRDPANPTWANLNSNPGAQWFWTDRIFFWRGKHDPESFVYQLFHTSRPGALDTSLISSDMINNPRTMNAFYSFGPRLQIARRWGKERLAGGGLRNKQFDDFDQIPENSPLQDYYRKPDVWTPRVLKDGADSAGGLGSLNRVFINVGLFSEEWLLHFMPFIGGPTISPMEIAVADRNSSYWKATEAQTPDTALFFLAATPPDKLAAAPGGPAHIDQAQLPRGKVVFAEHCARCHSSKLPEKAFTDFFPNGGCVGPDYLDCWNEYWQWTKSKEFKAAARQIVLAPDFLEDNYLSTDLRIPVSLLETNACSPLGTNAIADDIWDNFSSQSYKRLPSVGEILVHHPITGKPRYFQMPAGGVGYTRVPSLASVWSTAPYFVNNALGYTAWSPSVADRMSAFDDAITQLLYPEKRDGRRYYVTLSGRRHPGIIDRTTQPSYLTIAPGFLPGPLRRLSGFLDRFIPNVFGGGGVRIGPIPQGTPVNLLSNVDLHHRREVIRLALKIKHDLDELPRDYTDAQARKVFANLVEPLLELSTCPDFVVNRGHYFGTAFLPANERETPLSPADKQALIELLKTF
ncbi:MAG TPA: hypothetical protein VF121_10590 [Thermoanaerobaculia bacterium]|nr:hypothetical protein [Thermoanaerobaculia bacterium]